jgi:predicted amidophosphoribosyltransferase
MKTWLVELRELLLPTVCAGCDAVVAPERVLCAACDAALPRAGSAEPPIPGVDLCVAGAEFRDATLAWIRRFKYPEPGITGLDPRAGRVVRALVDEAAARVAGPPPDCVIPIPMHPRRLRARSFNPAALLARDLARRRRWVWRPAALRRVRDTPSQTGLGAAARRRNVRGAFRAPRTLPPGVWLVDDVVTTGSTLSEAARACHAAGARRVVAVCAASTRPGA